MQADAAREEGGGDPSNQPLVAPRRTAKGRLVISRQSMETAFAAVCKAYVPRPGQPMSRTREEVTALAQVSLGFLFFVRLFCFVRGEGVTLGTFFGRSTSPPPLRKGPDARLTGVILSAYLLRTIHFPASSQEGSRCTTNQRSLVAVAMLTYKHRRGVLRCTCVQPYPSST